MTLLDNTIGTQFIGVAISVFFLGFTCIQTWYYFRHYTDGIHVRATVAVVCIFEILRAAFGLHAMYYWLITHYAEPTFLRHIPWTISMAAGVIALIALVVHLFYAHRIYCVSGHNIWLSGVIVVLSLAQTILTWIYIGFCLKDRSLRTVIGQGRIYTPVLLAVGVAADVLIAGSLCFFLNKSRTGHRRTDVLINRLLLYALSNGLATSTLNILALIFHIELHGTFAFFAVFQVLGTTYANSFLATLNARRATRPEMDVDNVEVDSPNFVLSHHSGRIPPVIHIQRSVVTVVDSPHGVVPAAEKTSPTSSMNSCAIDEEH